MPELPEVETVRRVLTKRIAGLRVTAVSVPPVTFYRRPPKSSVRGLAGERLDAIGRRGKYLILRFEKGRQLMLHLGMSGRLALSDGPAPRGGGPAPRGGGPAANGAARHLRFELSLGSRTLRFYDPRRFGRVGCGLPRAMGPEPLDCAFGAAYLRSALSGRKAPIKAALMDQSIVAGLGNIYATEVLFRAGIRPGRASGRLTGPELERLTKSIRKILREGIARGGCTLDDEAFLDPLGKPGRYQYLVAVYGRKEGLCGHALKTTRRPIGGRTSVYCPRCQK